MFAPHSVHFNPWPAQGQQRMECYMIPQYKQRIQCTALDSLRGMLVREVGKRSDIVNDCMVLKPIPYTSSSFSITDSTHSIIFDLHGQRITSYSGCYAAVVSCLPARGVG
jgi:hypothetical protein